jgi:hypothetical protein
LLRPRRANVFGSFFKKNKTESEKFHLPVIEASQS